MKTLKYLITFIFFAASFLRCQAACDISAATIDDYLDIASIYEQNHDYEKALEYIESIESYDEYNPKMIYKKAYLLKSLNRISEAETELEKLILLNEDYACSELAQSLLNPQDKSLCSSGKN